MCRLINLETKKEIKEIPYKQSWKITPKGAYKLTDYNDQYGKFNTKTKINKFKLIQ